MTDIPCRRRQRINNACEACKQGKRKCDGGSPACSLCTQHRRTCIYTCKTASRTSRVRTLEAEVARLQRLVTTLQGEVAGAVVTEDAVTKFSPEPIRPRGNINSREQNVNGPGTDAERLQPSTSAAIDFSSTDWITTRYPAASVHGPMGVYSIAADHEHVLRSSSSLSKELQCGCEHLVLNQEVDHILRAALVDRFHLQVNRFARFVGEELGPCDQNLQSLPIGTRLFQSAVLAVGATITPDPAVKQLGLDLVRQAQLMIIPAISGQIDFEIIQGLNILTWLGMVTGNDLQSSIYSSLANGLINYLGLHVTGATNSEIEQLNSSDYMVQIRTFWSFAYMDRMLSAAMGKLPCVQWRHVQTPEYRTAFRDNTISIEDLYFDSTCRLWRLFDTLMDEVYSPSFRSLLREGRCKLLARSEASLNDFFSCVDHRLLLHSTASKVLPEAYFFHIAFHTSLILCNRPFLKESAPNDCRGALLSMAKSTTSISDTIKRYRKKYSFADAPAYMVFHITRACVVFLLLAISTSDGVRRKAATGVKHCLEALEECGQTWQTLSQRSIRLARELATRWRVIRALPMRYSNFAYSAGSQLCREGANQESSEGPDVPDSIVRGTMAHTQDNLDYKDLSVMLWADLEAANLEIADLTWLDDMSQCLLFDNRGFLDSMAEGL